MPKSADATNNQLLQEAKAKQETKAKEVVKEKVEAKDKEVAKEKVEEKDTKALVTIARR